MDVEPPVSGPWRGIASWLQWPVVAGLFGSALYFAIIGDLVTKIAIAGGIGATLAVLVGIVVYAMNQTEF